MTREEMRAKAKDLWAASKEAVAQAYDIECALDHEDGDELAAEFHAALRDCYRDVPGAVERKDKAFAALEARTAERLAQYAESGSRDPGAPG